MIKNLCNIIGNIVIVIFKANRADINRAEQENLAAPLLKRLRFTKGKIEESCKGLESLIQLDDPVGVTLSAIALDEGLNLYKVSCSIGVIGVVFEPRPDALVQISCLCLKSGNAVFLKGGSEASATKCKLFFYHKERENIHADLQNPPHCRGDQGF